MSLKELRIGRVQPFPSMSSYADLNRCISVIDSSEHYETQTHVAEAVLPIMIELLGMSCISPTRQAQIGSSITTIAIGYLPVESFSQDVSELVFASYRSLNGPAIISGGSPLCFLSVDMCF